VGYRPAQAPAIGVLTLILVPASSEPELKTATLAAFERYVTLTEARMAGETSGASPTATATASPRHHRLARAPHDDIIVVAHQCLDDYSHGSAPRPF
jgi:hypothetical protein